MSAGVYFLLLGGVFLFTALLLQSITYRNARACGIVRCCFTLSLLQIALWMLAGIALGAVFFFLTVQGARRMTLPLDMEQTMAVMLGGILLFFAAAMLTGVGFLTRSGWFGFGMGRPLAVRAEETNGEIVLYCMERSAGSGAVTKKRLTFERSRENRERFAVFLQNDNK